MAGVLILIGVALVSVTSTALRSVGLIAPDPTLTVRQAPPTEAPLAIAIAPTVLPFAASAPDKAAAEPEPTSLSLAPTALSLAPTVPPLLPTPSPVSAPSPTLVPAIERLTVRGASADGVNMRIEPSATSARVKLLREGTVLERIGDDEEADGRAWRKVRDPADGATGWIAAEFVAAAAQPTVSSPRTVATPPTVAAQPTVTAQPTVAAQPTAAAQPAVVAQPTVAPQPTAGPTPPRLPAATVAPRPAAPPATAAPAAPAAKPAGGRAAPQGFNCPAGFPIKGNHATSGEFIYHPPGGQFYSRTRPEDCFATEADARAAGYRASQR